MCFSTSASFGAATILGVAGITTITKAQPHAKYFAAIPLLFSVQQFAEGFVWLTFTHTNYAAVQQIPIHILIVFAYVIWPVWIPLSIMLVEKNAKRKKALQVLLLTGIFISLYIAYCLCVYPVRAIVTAHHIKYTFGFPHTLLALTWLSDAFYFIASLLPPFISSAKRIWMFGVVITLSYIVSRIYFKDAVISVWCFFAAALSIIILLIISANKKSSYLFA